MSAPSKGQKNARIVMTTLLLTEEVTQEDRGSGGNYLLYGSSCAQITEEAEYVKQEHPQILGEKGRSGGWSFSCNPVARTMKETEEQLLLVSKENEVLKIKLEATREAGAQALRSASQQLYKSYQARAEELRRSHTKEKQQIQASNLQQEAKLQQSSENTSRLAEGVRDRHTRVTELQRRLQRMEEEKKALIEKKVASEKTLQQLMLRNEDTKRCLDLQQHVSTLREQICHLQRLIQAQHRGLRGVIQEKEELTKELGSQEKQIEDLTEKLSSLEARNKELQDQVDFWADQPKVKASKGVCTERVPRGFGAAPYVLLSRLRQQES